MEDLGNAMKGMNLGNHEKLDRNDIVTLKPDYATRGSTLPKVIQSKTRSLNMRERRLNLRSWGIRPGITEGKVIGVDTEEGTVDLSFIPSTKLEEQRVHKEFENGRRITGAGAPVFRFMRSDLVLVRKGGADRSRSRSRSKNRGAGGGGGHESRRTRTRRRR